MAEEGDALSLAEKKRRDQEDEDRKYAELDAQRQIERKEKQRREAIVSRNLHSAATSTIFHRQAFF
jgi:hypothetical protein